MESIDLAQARRLALLHAGLWRPEKATAHDVIERFGYLQLDTVSIAGARSHGIVLHSRLDGYHPGHAENLLTPGAPLFEYWGHEVSWMPLWLYPVLAFRRQQFRVHPWWGDVLARHPAVVKEIQRRLRNEGPLKTSDLEGKRSGAGGWWNLKVAGQVAVAMWSSGMLAIRERKAFHRTFDLPERVIPAEWRRKKPLTAAQGVRVLLEKALATHGWATTGTLARTWRLSNLQPTIKAALAQLQREGKIIACGCRMQNGDVVSGWISPADLDRVDVLTRERPNLGRAVLLSPFDPLLWDRARVSALFGFDHVLEIYKPAPQRKFGYYVLPVLAGDRLVARVDLKASSSSLRVLAAHFEKTAAAARAATQTAVKRYAHALQRDVEKLP